jgi:hypothetical protein
MHVKAQGLPGEEADMQAQVQTPNNIAGVRQCPLSYFESRFRNIYLIVSMVISLPVLHANQTRVSQHFYVSADGRTSADLEFFSFHG